MANDSAPADARANASHGLLMGSAIWDPYSKRAHLFYTTACVGAACVVAPPRALHIHTESLDPWPGIDANTQMPSWSSAVDITASLTSAHVHMIRFGPGTGVALGNGQLLVCGVFGNSADTHSSAGMACVNAEQKQIAVAGRMALPGVSAVAMASMQNSSVAFSLRVPDGLQLAFSDDHGRTFRLADWTWASTGARPISTLLPLPAARCNGALTVLPTGDLALAYADAERQINLVLRNGSNGAWTKLPAKFWKTGTHGEDDRL